jgi:hypothetical protein
MCAKGIDFDLVSTILLLDIGTVPTLWHFYFFFYHQRCKISNKMKIKKYHTVGSMKYIANSSWH